MSREIKFRAWEKENKNMFKVARFDFSDYTIYSHLFSCDGFLGENCEIMQYTGNNDKKDVEIYENDIVEDEYNRKYVVVFKGDCWRCEPLSKGLKNRWISNHLMVIGSIYENPELLEEVTK